MNFFLWFQCVSQEIFLWTLTIPIGNVVYAEHCCSDAIKTAGLAGGFHWPYKGLLPAAPVRVHEGGRQPHYLYNCCWSSDYFFVFSTGSPVNGSIYSLILIWSATISSCSWFFIYCSILFAFFPTVSTKYPLHQKCLDPYLYFKFACLSKIISELLPFKYPITSDTLYLGGILISMWMWSGHASASCMIIPFLLHKSLKICPIST